MRERLSAAFKEVVDDFNKVSAGDFGAMEYRTSEGGVGVSNYDFLLDGALYVELPQDRGAMQCSILFIPDTVDFVEIGLFVQKQLLLPTDHVRQLFNLLTIAERHGTLLDVRPNVDAPYGHKITLQKLSARIPMDGLTSPILSQIVLRLSCAVDAIKECLTSASENDHWSRAVSSMRGDKNGGDVSRH